MDGWNTTFLLEKPIFRGYVSFREGNIKSNKTYHPKKTVPLNSGLEVVGSSGQQPQQPLWLGWWWGEDF